MVRKAYPDCDKCKHFTVGIGKKPCVDCKHIEDFIKTKFEVKSDG
jgi:hypothetical protein